VPVYAYEFGHRTGPGNTREHGAYEWGAAHSAEMAYLFPSFLDPEEPTALLFNASERVLAETMKGYWDAFVREGLPRGKIATPRPNFNPAGQIISLQSNNRSFVLSTEMLGREHNCKFWEEINR
jgi:para-nitrobenzyl esterase